MSQFPQKYEAFQHC